MATQQQLIPLCMGERLKEVREQRGLELAEVAHELRIDEPVMQAIEDDRIEHLAPVYRRGYILSYAKYLDIDAEEIGQMLDSIGSEHPKLHTVFPEAGNPNQADRWIKATSYVLASLLVGTLAWQFTHEAVRLSQQGTGLISNAGNAGTADADSSRQALESSASQADSSTHVNASIAALDVLRQQRATRNSGGEGAWAAVQQASNDNAPGPALPPGEFLLELTASGDSWVEIYDANGQPLELDLVRGGSTKQYRGEAPFNIQFGRASAVNLFIDGQAVDLEPFTNGDVTQMMLDGSNSGSAPAQTEPGNG